MAPLQNIIQEYNLRVSAAQLVLSGLPYAARDREEAHLEHNTLAEGLFLKAFTQFENFVEAAFIAFCMGTSTLAGYSPTTRITNCTEDQVRSILKAGGSYLDWSRPQAIRQRADLYLLDGEPIRAGVDPKSGPLADIEKIRNMIAHDSAEASAAYGEVRRRILKAEPIFDMSPGQLLRVRRTERPSMSWASHYLAEMSQAATAIVQKSP